MRALKAFWQWLMEFLGVSEILCDSCRYDHPNACRNPQRPNATRCGEYKQRGS